MANQSKLELAIIQHPLTRIILGLLICMTVASVGQVMIYGLLDRTSLNNEIKNLIGGTTIACLFLGTYMLLYSFYEKRQITELSFYKLGKNLLIGIGLGVILQSLTILVIYLNHGFYVLSINSFLFLVPSLTMAFTAAISEEIIHRGIIFRLSEEKLGSYIALLISAVIFGAVHLGNPNSSLWAATSVAIEAGLLLGAAYIYSRNLWFPIAIHFAWNFTQSGIYGAVTSGVVMDKSLLTTKIEGTSYITGGSFGPEGSVQATIFCVIATVLLMILNHKQGKIMKPYWAKRL